MSIDIRTLELKRDAALAAAYKVTNVSFGSTTWQDVDPDAHDYLSWVFMCDIGGNEETEGIPTHFGRIIVPKETDIVIMLTWLPSLSISFCTPFLE